MNEKMLVKSSWCKCFQKVNLSFSMSPFHHPHPLPPFLINFPHTLPPPLPPPLLSFPFLLLFFLLILHLSLVLLLFHILFTYSLPSSTSSSSSSFSSSSSPSSFSSSSLSSSWRGKPEPGHVKKVFRQVNKFCYCRNRRRAPWRKHSFLKLNYIRHKI